MKTLQYYQKRCQESRYDCMHHNTKELTDKIYSELEYATGFGRDHAIVAIEGYTTIPSWAEELIEFFRNEGFIVEIGDRQLRELTIKTLKVSLSKQQPVYESLFRPKDIAITILGCILSALLILTFCIIF